MKEHILKCVRVPFEKKWEGKKPWEWRKNDRDFQEGDYLIEREYDPATDAYSGREILEKVTFLLHGGEFGIPEGYVIMTTEEITRR